MGFDFGWCLYSTLHLQQLLEDLQSPKKLFALCDTTINIKGELPAPYLELGTSRGKLFAGVANSLVYSSNKTLPQVTGGGSMWLETVPGDSQGDKRPVVSSAFVWPMSVAGFLVIDTEWTALGQLISSGPRKSCVVLIISSSSNSSMEIVQFISDDLCNTK